MIFRVFFGTVTAFTILSMPYHQMPKTYSQGTTLGKKDQTNRSPSESNLFDVLESGFRNDNDELYEYTQSRNKKSCSQFSCFQIYQFCKMVLIYKGRALSFLLHGATHVSASKKKVIFRKHGCFQQAMQDFDDFNPYNIKTFQEEGERYGVSAKINGHSDLNSTMKTARPELGIVVEFGALLHPSRQP